MNIKCSPAPGQKSRAAQTLTFVVSSLFIA